MKKLLLFLLSITLIFSLVACGMQNGSSNEEKQNTPDENTLQSTEKEFSYKMVELPLEKYDMERVKAVLSYVIYTDANPSEHSDFAIYTKDGTNLLEDDSIYAKYETTYVCHECTLKHAQTTKGDDLNTHDRIIAIRLVFKDEVYASEDLAVKTILYNDIEAKTGQTIELTANATMADIKLNEK